MAVQRLQVGEEIPLVIETPVGFIVIEWDTARGGNRSNRKLRITLPGKMVAHRGMDRAIAGVRWLTPNGAPNYTMLMPLMADGKIVDLAAPGVLKIGDSNGGSQKHTAVEDVADNHVGGHGSGHEAVVEARDDRPENGIGPPVQHADDSGVHNRE